MKLASFFVLFLLAIIHKVFMNILLWWIPASIQTTSSLPSEHSIELDTGRTVERREVETSDAPGAHHTAFSFSTMLKCTFIKLLKLYYTPVTNSALTMIHCVSIRDKSHLYIYGDHECYSAWQTGIIIIILPSLLVFPICFELAIRLLKNRLISPWQFVFATLCPFYSIVLYVWNWRTRLAQKEIDRASVHFSANEDSFRSTVLEGEELLFRETEGHSFGWTVVQFYRTFGIAALNTFIVNPVYRLMAYTALIMVFIVHDIIRKPYKDEYLNFLQALTSCSLVVIVLCNMIPAMSFLVDVRSVPSIQQVVNALEVVELIIYALVPLSLLMWHLNIFIDRKCRTVKEEW